MNSDLKRWVVAIYFNFDPGWFKAAKEHLEVSEVKAPDKQSAEAIAYSKVKVDGVIYRNTVRILAIEI